MSSILADSETSKAIRLIDFNDFVKLGSFPRFPENQDLTITLEQLPIERCNDSLIVFISHCWLRGWNGAEGWDGRPHPDNASGGKYRLCAEGIEQIRRNLAPGMTHCYIWLDFGCIDQDGNPAGELKLLDKVIKISDCIFSPIYDDKHEEWDYPINGWMNYFKQYKSSGWHGNIFSYLNRGWCRVEMFYAANIPLLQDNEERRSKMAGGLKSHREDGRRPHILYGSKETTTRRPVLLLPPLQNSYFEELHPEKGNLTKESDRVIIKALVEELRPYMKTITIGYEGQLMDGAKHGRGIYKYPNGDIYEGEWKGDKMDGKGKYTYISGDIYQGEWHSGKRNGRGKYRYANNDIYHGEFKDGRMSGRGIYKYANGNIYEGEYKDGLMHGFGIYKYPNGDYYEGEFKDGSKHGRGTFIYHDGDSYEGEYKDDKKNGRGIYKYAKGDSYLGEYKDGLFHGKGVYSYGNGALYDGEYENGNMHGKGMYKDPNGRMIVGEWNNDKLVHRDKDRTCIVS